MEYRYNFHNLDPRLRILSIVRFVRAFGRGSTFVFLPLVFISVYHLSFLLTGLLIGFATLLMATVQFLSGRWTDRIGRRSILVYSQIPGIFSYLAVYYSVAVPHFILLAVGGWYLTIFINAVQYPAVQAAVADMTSVSDRLAGFALIRVMANLGIAIGPLVGAYLAGYGLQYIFLIASFATGAEVVMLFLYMTETYTPTGILEKKEHIIRNTVKNDRFFLVFIAIGILLAFFTRQMNTSLTVYTVVLSNLPFLDLGAIWALNGFLVVILQFPILRAMTGRGNSMIWRGVGVIFFSAAFLVLTAVPTLFILLLSITIYTVGEDFTSPTTQAIVTTIAPGYLKGSYIGVYNLIIASGSFAGSILGLSLLYVLRDFSSTYWIYVSIGALIVAVLYVAISKPYTKRIGEIERTEIKIS